MDADNQLVFGIHECELTCVGSSSFIPRSSNAAQTKVDTAPLRFEREP